MVCINGRRIGGGFKLPQLFHLALYQGNQAKRSQNNERPPEIRQRRMLWIFGGRCCHWRFARVVLSVVLARSFLMRLFNQTARFGFMVLSSSAAFELTFTLSCFSLDWSARLSWCSCFSWRAFLLRCFRLIWLAQVHWCYLASWLALAH